MSEITLTVTDTHDATRTFQAASRGNLMEALRDAGFDDLLAMCGGACACATCHVYVDDPARLAGLAPMKPDEDGLLEGCDERRPNSRLSCQIRMNETLGRAGGHHRADGVTPAAAGLITTPSPGEEDHPAFMEVMKASDQAAINAKRRVLSVTSSPNRRSIMVSRLK